MTCTHNLCMTVILLIVTSSEFYIRFNPWLDQVNMGGPKQCAYGPYRIGRMCIGEARGADCNIT